MILRHRKRNRLKNYDYSRNGFYFLTICTKNKGNIFGDINNGAMSPNKCGQIVTEKWNALKKYDYVVLDDYVVMPDHLHAILFMRRPCRDRSRPVPTFGPMATQIKSLSELVGAFKTTSSKLIHREGFYDFAWQRSFYDHIIRDEETLTKIRGYILDNPIRWQKQNDRLCPAI